MKLYSLSSILVFFGLSACSDANPDSKTESISADKQSAICQEKSEDLLNPLYSKLKKEGKVECALSAEKRVCD